MPKMTPGKYQLVAIRGRVEVLRQSFDQLDDANQAVAEALVRHPDCEVRLIEGRAVLLSAAPAPPRTSAGGDVAAIQ